jgi:imidazolonepropionase-like amidohydrolase
MSILIEGSRIAAISRASNMKIPRDAQVVDLRGKFVTPGLADMHNHAGNGSETEYQRTLAELFRWGVTTVFSPGHSDPDLKVYTRIRNAPPDQAATWPRFYGVGRSISVKGGHASQYAAFLPETPAEIPSIITRLKTAGADAIKLIYDDLSHTGRTPVPVMRRDVMETIIRESHKAGLKAYVHAPQLKYAKEALRAGADGLVHAVCDQVVDDEFINLMKKNGALYITTHSLRRVFADLPRWVTSLEKFDDRQRIPKAIYETWKSRKFNPISSQEQLSYLKSNLRRVFDADILVVAGTDTGVTGVSSQMELVVLVQDGLSPAEALRTATINAARMLGREADLGSVAPGKLADLVVLDQNPLQDITNIRTLHLVLKGGRVHDVAAGTK